jgi:hypothetical protein
VREIDFIPEWYASVRRRTRLLKAQSGVLAAAAIAILAWDCYDAGRISTAEGPLQLRDKQLEISANRVRERTEQQRLREQLQTQERVDSSLGLNVESSRLLAMLDAALPRQGSLTELTIDTDENNRSLTQQVAAGKSASPLTPERRLKVSLKGVTPSNGEIASLLDNLNATRFCDGVRLIYSRDRVDGDHVMCEFQVEFSINLNSEGSTL